MAKKQNNNIFSSQYSSGIAFVGSIILGVGIGLLEGQVAAYTLIGTGLGFVFAALISISGNNRFLNR